MTKLLFVRLQYNRYLTLKRSFPIGGAAYGTPKYSSTSIPETRDEIKPRTSPYIVCRTLELINVEKI